MPFIFTDHSRRSYSVRMIQAKNARFLNSLLLVMLIQIGLFLLPAKGSVEYGPFDLQVHTATSHVLVVTFSDGFEPERLPVDPLETDNTDWQVNAHAPVAVHHTVRTIDELPKQKDGTYPIETGYAIYLDIGEPLVNGNTYEISGPFGSIKLLFNDRNILNESLKVNQVGYHPQSTVRYANLGVYLGSGGPVKLELPLEYRVLRFVDKQPVHTGTAEYRGDDTLVDPKIVSSGEHVYRLDLSPVPAGGPYVVHVPGWGISHPFEISSEAIGTIAATALRGLYHQRCGIALEAPWTAYTRDACHTQVALTRTPWVNSPSITVPKDMPMVPMSGGHHDAGDFDRRGYHAIVPILLMGYLEAFPENFSDGQARIPESGNGLPDILDEALWAIRGWENLQISDSSDPQYGGIMGGTETKGHPEYGVVDAATDRRLYGTWEVDTEITAFGAGMMAQAARLLSGYEAWETRARQLYGKALLAWSFLERMDSTEEATAHHMYAALQLSLASVQFGDTVSAQAFHTLFKRSSTVLLVEDGSWPHQYRPGNIMATVQTVHFSSYLVTALPTDTTLAGQLGRIVLDQAEKGGYMGFDMESAMYPQGATKSYGWGAATAQGRYADVHVFAYRLTEDVGLRKRQFAILSQYADYALGLNPLGVSYITGLGAVQPKSPLHLDSWTSRQRGLGPVPGILVYGPTAERSGVSYQRVVSDTLYPRWDDLPTQRRWTDGWSLVNNNEFTIWETMVWNIGLYGVLDTPDVSGQGGVSP